MIAKVRVKTPWIVKSYCSQPAVRKNRIRKFLLGKIERNTMSRYRFWNVCRVIHKILRKSHEK